MTHAEELLEAVKEHATADDDFAYYGSSLYVHRIEGVRVHVQRSDGKWVERINGAMFSDATHNSASSAVYSAFLRARAKHPPAADSAEES
jgi:hypothetical protein